MHEDLQDARGRRFARGSVPQRIISLVPSLTELLVDLGLEDRLAGVTRFCVHPSGIKMRKTIVGGTKQVNVARALALEPDLVVANLEENNRADVEALEQLCPVFVTDVRSVEDAVGTVSVLGRLTGTEETAEGLASEIQRRFAAMPRVEAVDTLYLIWRRPYMSVGRDTFIHDMMKRIGLRNVCGNASRYPELSEEEIAERSPAVVLLSSEPFPFNEQHIPEISRILPGALVLTVDGELFSWYGSRMLHAPAYLMRLRQMIDDQN